MSDEGPAILVVDDYDDNRYTLVERLQHDGYANVSAAANGQEAMDLLAEQPFDLVLLDIMMPVMNGYQVLERIKSDMALRDIPVIMISAHDEMESVVRCIEQGAEDHLSKPFNAAVLKARIGACLERKRLRDQQTSYLKQIEEEKKRADDLLHAALPAAAVQELKTSDCVQPRRFEDVAVLFCDVVDFTEFCDRHAPEEVVGHLQTLVTRFEEIAAEHGLEKIKTIGEEFMATAVLLLYVPEPAVASVRCGLQMVAAAKTLEAAWDVKVGIHVGPVVAGVIGRRNYGYDLWGDTVNIAARIVDQAERGSVLVSSATWRRLGGAFQGVSKGLVDLKGKGDLELIECLDPESAPSAAAKPP